MREIRPYGSEGGAALRGRPYPYQAQADIGRWWYGTRGMFPVSAPPRPGCGPLSV